MLKWLRPEPVFVPLVADNRTYESKWHDPEYLRGLVAMAGNEYWRTELLNGLARLRDAADKAQTPDELRGCNAGIAVLKAVLTSPAKAKLVLEVEKSNE